MKSIARLFVLAVLAVLALPAAAAEEAGKSGEKSGQKGGKPGTNVDMPFLMAPLTDADGKLTGYAYISSRLTAANEAVVTDVREKLPFIQDLAVRDINGAGVTVADDPEKVDIAGVEARLLADARKIMGAGKVNKVMICTVQIAELRPVQTPALYTPPDKQLPADSKNPVKSRCES
jgi:hypothetical protein